MHISNLTPLEYAPVVVNTKSQTHLTRLCQSHAVQQQQWADGRADSEPNGCDAPLNKWITINGQALIPHKLFFLKRLAGIN